MVLYLNVTLVTCLYLCRLQQGGAALPRSEAKVENLENDGKNFTHHLTIHYHIASRKYCRSKNSAVWPPSCYVVY